MSPIAPTTAWLDQNITHPAMKAALSNAGVLCAEVLYSMYANDELKDIPLYATNAGFKIQVDTIAKKLAPSSSGGDGNGSIANSAVNMGGNNMNNIANGVVGNVNIGADVTTIGKGGNQQQGAGAGAGGDGAGGNSGADIGNTNSTIGGGNMNKMANGVKGNVNISANVTHKTN